MPQLGVGKKRYSVTLTEENVRQFQALCKELNYPSTMLSHACDEVIEMVNKEWQEIVDRRRSGIRYGLGDVFRLAGDQIDLFEKKSKGGKPDVRASHRSKRRKAA